MSLGGRFRSKVLEKAVKLPRTTARSVSDAPTVNWVAPPVSLEASAEFWTSVPRVAKVTLEPPDARNTRPDPALARSPVAAVEVATNEYA